MLGLGFDVFAHEFAGHSDRAVQQVADNLLHVTPNIADFGELGRFDLDKRRAGQLCQTAADLSFANAGGADHQDVFGVHLVAQVIRQLLAPPAVAQRNSNSALCVFLANNIAV